MRVDATTAEVVSALRASGVRSILLKGPAVGRWLYGEVGERRYTDTDLLISPHNRRQAQRVLRRLGFRRGQRGLFGVAREWHRGRDFVDLHISLVGVEASPATAWSVLSRETTATAVGWTEVDILGPPARALHLATHVAQHHAYFPRASADLERALSVLPPELWRAAAALASELGAEGAFAAGLRRVPNGAAMVTELGLDARSSAATALLEHGAPPTALGFAQLAASRSPVTVVTLAFRALVPRRSYMRREWRIARRGELGLAAAYVLRVVHLARNAPRGLRAWRSAR